MENFLTNVNVKVKIINRDGEAIDFNCQEMMINQSYDSTEAYSDSNYLSLLSNPASYEVQIINPDKIIREGENKMENIEPTYRYAKFTFPSNRQKFYTYRVGPEVRKYLKLNNEYYVITEKGYNYKLAQLRFEGYVPNAPNVHTTEIIVVWDAEYSYVHSDYPEYNDINHNALQGLTSTAKALGADIPSYCEATKNIEVTEDTKDTDFDSLIYDTFKKIFTDINNKGEDNMNSKIFNGMEFGQIEATGRYAMTLKGIAFYSIATSGENAVRTFVQYNPETNQIEDVTPLVISEFSAGDFLYKMPVAISNVKVGDIVFSNSSPVFVKEVKENNELVVVNPETKAVETILPPKNIFGFNYITKIVNLMENFNLNSSATADQPFGNLLPLMMLNGDRGNMKDLIPLMLLSNGINGVNIGTDFMNNPLMLYCLFDGEKNKDMLPFLLMGNGIFGNNVNNAN